MSQPTDSKRFGLDPALTEDVSRRARGAKHFRHADGQTWTGIFAPILHYEAAPGQWEDIDTGYEDRGGGVHVADRLPVRIEARATGISVVNPETGAGIRWLTSHAPRILGNVAEHDEDDGLTWQHENQIIGVKATAVISASHGPQTYGFRYQLIGHHSQLEVDETGNITCDAFVVPVPRILGADGSIYQASAWSLGPGPLATFSFDDSDLPPEAYPYTIDPTTTITVAAAGDAIFFFTSTSGYPPGATTGSAGAVFVQSFSSSTWQIDRSKARWNTSSIPAGSTVNSASLVLSPDRAGSTGTGHWVASWTADWGGGTSASDPLFASGTALGAQSYSPLSAGTASSYTLLSPSNVNISGYTALSITPQQDGATNSDWYCGLVSGIQLQVTYTLPAYTSVSVSPNVASPAYSTQAVRFTATAAGGSGTAYYRFQRWDPTNGWAVVQNWSTTNFWDWNTTGWHGATYLIYVDVSRDAGATIDTNSGNISYVVQQFTATGEAISPSAGAFPSQSVTISAAASGAGGTPYYQFYVDGALRQDWSPTASYSWNTIGVAIGNHTLVVYTTHTGNSFVEASSSITYSIVGYTSVSLSPSPVSPQPVATSVVLTATASNSGSFPGGTPEYQFYIDGVLVRDWSSTSTYTWNTIGATSGNHTLVTYTRHVGNTYVEASTSITYVIQIFTSVTLSSTPASPIVQDAGVAFTAGVSGAIGTPEFQYLVDSVVHQGWSTLNTFNWNTAGLAVGTHTILCQARHQNNTYVEASNSSVYTVNPHTQAIGGTLASAGSLSARDTVLHAAMSGLLSLSGSVAARPPFRQLLTAALALAGTVVRRPPFRVGGLQGTLATSGVVAFARKTFFSLSGRLATIGSLSKLTSSRQNATLGSSGSVTPLSDRPIQNGQSVPAGSINSNSVPLTSPSTTKVGDVLIAQVAFRGGSGVTCSSAGWTLLDRKDGTNISQAIFWRYAALAGTQIYTWALGTTQVADGCIRAWTMVDQANAVPVCIGSAVNIASTTYAAPGVTTQRAKSPILVFYAIPVAIILTAPTSFDNPATAESRQGATRVDVASYDEQVGAVAAYGPFNASSLTSSDYVAHSVVVQPIRLPITLSQSIGGTLGTAGALHHSQFLTGLAIGKTTTAAVLKRTFNVRGTSAGASVAVLSQIMDLKGFAGRANGVTAISAAVIGFHRLIGAAIGKTSTVGRIITPYQGLAVGRTTPLAALTGRFPLAVPIAAGLTTITGSLLRTQPAASPQTHGATAASGDLGVLHRLSGSSAGRSRAFGSLAETLLFGSADGSTEASLSLSTPFTGRADGKTTAGADTISFIDIGLQAIAMGKTAIVAALTKIHPLLGLAQGVTTPVVRVGDIYGVSAAEFGATSISADLKSRLENSGDVYVRANVEAGSSVDLVAAGVLRPDAVIPNALAVLSLAGNGTVWGRIDLPALAGLIFVAQGRIERLIDIEAGAEVVHDGAGAIRVMSDLEATADPATTDDAFGDGDFYRNLESVVVADAALDASGDVLSRLTFDSFPQSNSVSVVAITAPALVLPAEGSGDLDFIFDVELGEQTLGVPTRRLWMRIPSNHIGLTLPVGSSFAGAAAVPGELHLWTGDAPPVLRATLVRFDLSGQAHPLYLIGQTVRCSVQRLGASRHLFLPEEELVTAVDMAVGQVAYELPHPFRDPGSYTLQFLVIDNIGNHLHSVPVTILVRESV